jgi:hypothetical protein
VKREEKTKGEKRSKNKREARKKQSAKRSYKEQAGITLRDNSHLLYEVTMLIIS